MPRAFHVYSDAIASEIAIPDQTLLNLKCMFEHIPQCDSRSRFVFVVSFAINV